MSGELTFSFTRLDQSQALSQALSAGSPASPSSATAPKDDSSSSAKPLSAGSANGSSVQQRQNAMQREIAAKTAEYAPRVGVTLRPLRNHVDQQKNVTAVYDQLVANAPYDKGVAAGLQNFVRDLGKIIEKYDAKGLNLGIEALDSGKGESSEISRNLKREFDAAPKQSKKDDEQLWGNSKSGEKPSGSAGPTEPKSQQLQPREIIGPPHKVHGEYKRWLEFKPPEQNNENNSVLPKLEANETPPGGEPLW